MTVWSFDTVRAVWPHLVRGFGITLGATLCGLLIAGAAGLVLAIARRSGPAPVRWTAAAIVEFVRSTPLLVQLFFLYYALPLAGVRIGAFGTGALGLGLHYAAYLSEVYRTGIDSVPRGQWDVARALGFRPFALWTRVILPQAARPVLPALGNYAVAMFKETPLLSSITLVEMLGAARIYGSRTGRYLEPITLAGVLFLGVSLLSVVLLRRVERRLGAAWSPR